MSRIRTVKPEFFKHYGLYSLEKESSLPVRIAFEGLWTVADREGRFKWCPPELKISCLPYDDVDFSRVLHALTTCDFIRKYTVNGVEYGVIPSFKEHQVINNREKASVLPEPPEVPGPPRDDHASPTREVHALVEGKGKEGKGKEQDNKKTITKKFIPPTVSEVSEYCTERKNNIDPERFFDHYTANGWVQGQGKKIKDWRACVRTWEKRDSEQKTKPLGYQTSQEKRAARNAEIFDYQRAITF